MTQRYTAGTRQKSLTEELGFYPNELGIKSARTWDIVEGVPAGGTAPCNIYQEGRNPVNTITLSGQPIPAADGSFAGLADIDDAALVATLANIVDGEVFDIAWSSGLMISKDPEFKKNRSGAGREFSFTIEHNPFM